MQTESWVAVRIACTAHMQFEALVEIVDMDVSAVNMLPPDQRNHCTFALVREGDAFQVQRRKKGESLLFVEFGISRQGLYTKNNLRWGTGEKFTVSVNWNTESGVCQLTIDDTPVSLQDVSRRALHPLFFPHLED